MTLGVGLGLGTGEVVPALLEPCAIGGLSDASLSEVQGGVDQRLGNGGAVEGTLNEQEPFVGSFDPELVDLVVVDGLVAEGEGRELEILSFKVGLRGLGLFSPPEHLSAMW